MGALAQMLGSDHERLEELLRRSIADPSTVDLEPYREFRAGLLRHMAMEDKVLAPLAAECRGGPLPVFARLRADHGVFATLLVPTPKPAIVREFLRRLPEHNGLEEGVTGMYEEVERLLGPDRLATLMDRLRAFPQPPPAPFSDNPRVLAKVAALTGG